MQALATLESAGYVIELRRADGIEQVVAKRTERAQLSAQAASPFLLALSRNQEEALEIMRSRRRGELYRAIASGSIADPAAEARAIAEYNLLIGNTTASDGTPWRDLV